MLGRILEFKGSSIDYRWFEKEWKKPFSSNTMWNIWLDLNLRMQIVYSQFKKYRVYLSRMIGNTPYPTLKNVVLISDFLKLNGGKMLIRIMTKTFQIKEREIDVN